MLRQVIYYYGAIDGPKLAVNVYTVLCVVEHNKRLAHNHDVTEHSSLLWQGLELSLMAVESESVISCGGVICLVQMPKILSPGQLG